MELKQSAVAVTMIGKKEESSCRMIKWFSYGDTARRARSNERADEVASIRLNYEATADNGMVQRIWPVGSRGILRGSSCANEQSEDRGVKTVLDVEKTAGPSTVVLLAVPVDKIEAAKSFFGKYLNEFRIADVN